jgi:thiamine-phosphate pyrophosphorylase
MILYFRKKLNADGCHLGQKDMDIKNARKIIGNKIIGITCHNSIKLAKVLLKKMQIILPLELSFPLQPKK